MSEWEPILLKDMGRLVTGKTPPTAEPVYYGGSIPFVTPSDMTGERMIIKTGRTVTDLGVRKVRSSFIDQPAVVVSCIGSDMGKAAMVDSAFVSNQQINAIIPYDGFDVHFIYYNLSARKEEIRSKASGAAQPIMNKTDFGKLELMVPDLKEQKAIAKVLSSLDDKIENNRRMNATLEAMAQAIFKDWFVDFGPVHRKLSGMTDPVAILGGLITDPEKAFQTATLFPDNFGENGLPKGWKEEPLIDQANWVNGAAYKNMYFVERSTGLPVIKIAELKNGVTDQTKFTNTDLGRKYRIDDGELLFSWSGNPETSIDTFLWSGGPGWLNQHIFAVRSNGKHTKPLLFALLKYLKPEFTRIATDKQTTGLGHVTRGDMGRLMVNVASKEIYSAFNMIVEPMFDRLSSAVHENITLAKTRDYLLPRLMSGQIRAAILEAGGHA